MYIGLGTAPFGCIRGRVIYATSSLFRSRTLKHLFVKFHKRESYVGKGDCPPANPLWEVLADLLWSEMNPGLCHRAAHNHNTRPR